MSRPLGFDLHGVRLAVEAPPGRLRDAIVERLAFFRSGAEDDAAATVTVLEAAPEGLATPGGRVVYDSRYGDVLYDPEREELRLFGEGLGFCCRGADGEARIWVDRALREAEWLASRPLLSLVLFELLKRRGLYVGHAAGAVVDGRAILLAGGSGVGKSTLCVALARAGFRLLGDDLVFLARDGAGVSVLAFPEPIDLAADSASLFPELAHLRTPPKGWPKHRVPISLFGAEPARAATPGLIVFPSSRGGPSTQLQPLAPAEALLAMAPNILLTEPRTSQLHLDALGALADESLCYRLHAGDDLGEVVERLAARLAEAGATNPCNQPTG